MTADVSLRVLHHEFNARQSSPARPTQTSIWSLQSRFSLDAIVLRSEPQLIQILGCHVISTRSIYLPRWVTPLWT